MTDRTDLQTFAILGAAVVAGVLLWRFSREAGGLVTGNNGITQSATNAAGRPVTAYQGAGVVGTIGAATNAASGGVLASMGEALGNWFYDLTHSDPQPGNQASQTASATQQSGWDYTGKDQSFEALSSADGWWPYPLQPLGGIPSGVS